MALFTGLLVLAGAATAASVAKDAESAHQQNKASKTLDASIGRQQAAERRQLIRESRIARAEAVSAAASQDEGGLTSSAGQGARASIESQIGFNIKYFDVQAAADRKYRRQLARAGKAAAGANLFSGIASVASSAAGAVGAPTKTGAPT